MIVNVLRLTLREDMTDEVRAEVLAALRTIDHVVGLADTGALERYLHDPIHLRGEELILPNLVGGSAPRFATEPVADQVNQMAAAKAAKYPEWGKRVNELFGDRPA